MHRPEQRKILYVITDGDVGDEGENRKICASAKKENVEIDVLCIGEQHVSGQHGFRKFQRVATHAPAQLQRAIFDTLQRVV